VQERDRKGIARIRREKMVAGDGSDSPRRSDLAGKKQKAPATYVAGALREINPPKD
jgi:hypothetical protein